MNRVDLKGVRIQIRRLADSAIIDLENNGKLLSSDGENNARSTIDILVALVEALDDYEAQLPQIIPSARTQAGDQLV